MVATSKEKSSSSDKGFFLGDTKGNKDMNHNLSEQSTGADITGKLGGAGETGKSKDIPDSDDNNFLGPTKGNEYLPPERSSYNDSEIKSAISKGSPQAKDIPDSDDNKFLGPTKGNKDLPVNRTQGIETGHGGGAHKKGGLPPNG